MIKKAWHILISLWGGFFLAAILVGGVLAHLGFVPEALVTRVVWLVTPLTGMLCYWLFYIYDGRTEEERKAAAKAARRERSRYHDEEK